MASIAWAQLKQANLNLSDGSGFPTDFNIHSVQNLQCVFAKIKPTDGLMKCLTKKWGVMLKCFGWNLVASAFQSKCELVK